MLVTIVLVGMLLLIACAAAPEQTHQELSTPVPVPVYNTLTSTHMIDLGHHITQDMPTMPGEPRTQFVRDPENNELLAFQMSVQSSTYLSMPAQLNQQPYPRTIDQLSPRDLVRATVVIDQRDAAQDTPGYRLTVADIETWEQQHGRVPAGAFVLLATGWDMRWGTPDEYLNLGAGQVPQVPGYGQNAAEWLLSERQVAGLGIDTPTIGELPAGVIRPEPVLFLLNMTRLEQLPPVGATLVLAPVALQHSNASPTRVLAFVP